MRRLASWRIALGVMVGLFLGWRAGGMVSGAPASLGALEGVWKVHVTPDEQAQSAGEKDFKDTLDFKPDNSFIDEAFKKKAFNDGRYEVDQRPYSPAQFSATIKAKGDKPDVVTWKGIATGQTIKGEMVWAKKDGSVVNYTFNGERK